MGIPSPTLSSFVAIAGLVAAFLLGRELTVNKCKNKDKPKPWLKSPFNIITYVVLALAGLVALFNTGGRFGMGGMGGMGMGGGLFG